MSWQKWENPRLIGYSFVLSCISLGVLIGWLIWG